MKIWKYVFDVNDETQELHLPRGTRIVHVGSQDNQVCAWAVVGHDERDTEKRCFRVVGTGHEFAVNMKHVGTVQMSEFVWHLLEITK